MHKNILSSVAFAASSLLATACGPAQKDLADLQNLTVLVSAPESQPPSFQAFVVSSDTCVAIHPSAALDGVVVPLTQQTSSGAWFLPPFPTRCPQQSFVLADRSSAVPDANGVSTLVIADGSKTLTLGIRNLGVQRTVSVVSPADGAVTAGTRVTLAWSSPADVLDPNKTVVTLVPSQGQSLDLWLDQLTVEGSNISFDMPATAAGAVSVRVESPSADIATCDGPARCVGDAENTTARTALQVQ